MVWGQAGATNVPLAAVAETSQSIACVVQKLSDIVLLLQSPKTCHDRYRLSSILSTKDTRGQKKNEVVIKHPAGFFSRHVMSN